MFSIGCRLQIYEIMQKQTSISTSKAHVKDGLPVMPVNEKDVAVVMRRLTENGHTP